MSEHTNIEWADHTFNPWLGCSKIGPACENCYAESWAKRAGHPELWQGERRRTSAEYWREPLKWDRAAAKAGKRARVFPSLCDPFDNQVDPQWRMDFWGQISRTPNLDWLLLTKRPQNILRMLPELPFFKEWPWPNVWLGVSAGNHEEANRNIPILLRVPAAVRFASLEPLLGAIDLRGIWDYCPTHDFHGGFCVGRCPDRRRLDLVITGGETGPKARPIHPRWPRRIRDDCTGAGIAFFFKRWGEWAPVCALDDDAIERIYHPAPEGDPEAARACKVKSHVLHADGSQHDMLEPMAFAAGVGAMTMFRVGVRAAGRVLDGRTWDEMPAQRQRHEAESNPASAFDTATI